MANILVVDDDGHIIEQLELLLESFGHNPITSLYPQNLFDILAAEKVDLLLLDIYMPELDGLTLLKQLKEQEEYSELPVIILTGDTNEKLISKAFSLGAIDFINKPLRKHELQARLHSLLRLQEEIARRKEKENELNKMTQQLKIANEVLQDLATTDPLTNINNRSFFDRNLELEWKRSLREKEPLSLLMLDIDYFKPYNDNYGHQAGDLCLIRVVEAIHSQLKRSADILSRYGGEEFTVILPNTDSQGAYNLGEKIRKEVENLNITHHASPIKPVVTISIGMSTLIPNLDISQEQLFKQADDALYLAKRFGRNQCRIFGNEKQQATS